MVSHLAIQKKDCIKKKEEFKMSIIKRLEKLGMMKEADQKTEIPGVPTDWKKNTQKMKDNILKKDRRAVPELPGTGHVDAAERRIIKDIKAKDPKKYGKHMVDKTINQLIGSPEHRKPGPKTTIGMDKYKENIDFSSLKPGRNIHDGSRVGSWGGKSKTLVDSIKNKRELKSPAFGRMAGTDDTSLSNRAYIADQLGGLTQRWKRKPGSKESATMDGIIPRKDI